jgi:ClpP class serine protease
VFIAAVARGRGVSVEKVLSDFGRGDVLIGQAAVDAGLADSVGTLDSLLAELSAGDNAMKNQTVAAAPENKPTASVGSGKCSSCRAAMSDSDPMYCKGCFDGDDDDDDDDDMDSKKAQAFRAAVLALLACDDEAKAIGALTGYKAQAEQATAKLAEVEAQLALATKAKQDAEIGAKLDAAVAEGRIKPAAREQFEKLYASHGAPALEAALSVLTPAAAVAPAEPATEEKAQEAAKAAAEKASAWQRKTPVLGDLTDEQKAVIAKVGVAPEKFEAHRRALYRNLAETENK